MNYYIEYQKTGLATQCSRTKYYKVKRAVLTSSTDPICLYEYKSKFIRYLVIL